MNEVVSFNPYCAGFAVGSWVADSYIISEVEFQSLLCWICCGKSRYFTRSWIFCSSFNPYCAGFAVGSSLKCNYIDAVRVVSILIVLDLLWEVSL